MTSQHDNDDISDKNGDPETDQDQDQDQMIFVFQTYAYTNAWVISSPTVYNNDNDHDDKVTESQWLEVPKN